MFDASMFQGEYPLTQYLDVWLPDRKDLTFLKSTMEAREYISRVYVLPEASNRKLGAYETYEGTVVIEPGTYLLGVGCYASVSEGFEFQIIENGSDLPLFARKFGFSGFGGSFTYNNVDYMNSDGYILSPLVVLLPGSVRIEITNGSQENIVQVMLRCAQPISRYSLDLHDVRK